MVTRALSPPSCPMFSWTQCSARLWSRNPCPKQVLMNFLCSNSFVCDASYFYPECVTLPLDLFIFHWPGYQTPAPCPGWADQGAPVCSWPWQWWGHNQSGTGARTCHLRRDDILLSLLELESLHVTLASRKSSTVKPDKNREKLTRFCIY